ncbi:MAG: DNA-directed RNA polymerase subunit P [Candidatus Hydrothermarchaeales archaeon]
MYKCSKCGKTVELEAGAPVRCPFCGHKILFKERSKVKRTIKAR